jgi:hypothetical protein
LAKAWIGDTVNTAPFLSLECPCRKRRDAEAISTRPQATRIVDAACWAHGRCAAALVASLNNEAGRNRESGRHGVKS